MIQSYFFRLLLTVIATAGSAQENRSLIGFWSTDSSGQPTTDVRTIECGIDFIDNLRLIVYRHEIPMQNGEITFRSVRVRPGEYKMLDGKLTINGADGDHEVVAVAFGESNTLSITASDSTVTLHKVSQ